MYEHSNTRVLPRLFQAAAVAFALVLGACAATDGGGGGTDAGGASGKSGSELWGERCSLCHNLRSPDGYSDTQWEVAVRHMRSRAQLTGSEESKILAFLQSGN